MGAGAAAVLRGASMTSTERVDRALRGQEVDRAPFSFWHHFLDPDKPPEVHAKSTLAFHERYRTDLVKVMSDYPYPKPAGKWYEAKVVENPFPRQIRALELVRDALGGKAYFVETIFNPFKVAENLSSHNEVMALKDKSPQKLLDALEAIAKSEANHAKRAMQAGAAGVLFSIANAQKGVMTEADYAKFSEPFDRIVMEAVAGAPLGILHLHTDAKYGDSLYARRFYKGWPATAINYTLYTDIPIAEARKNFSGVLLAGIDERKYRSLNEREIKQQWQAARHGAGPKFILTPGCSVPNDSTPEELLRLPRVLGAI